MDAPQTGSREQPLTGAPGADGALPRWPILCLLPFLAGVAGAAWTLCTDLKEPPAGIWSQSPDAYLSLRAIVAPILRLSLALILGWGAVLATLGPRATERRLRWLLGGGSAWSPRGWAVCVAILLSMLLLLRFWTFRHYVQLPLQIRGNDSWTFYSCANAMHVGEDPYDHSETVGDYAYPPWLLTLIAPAVPDDPNAIRLRHATRAEGSNKFTFVYQGWKARWALARWLLIPPIGLALLSLVAPPRRAMACALLVPLLLGHQEIAKDLRQGQITLCLLAVLVAYAVCLRHGRPFLGGFIAGLSVPTKIFPGLLLPYSLWTREYRTAAGIALGTAVGFLVPVFALDRGWDLTKHAFAVMSKTHEALYTTPSPYEHNQSLLMGVARLFPPVEAGEPSPAGRVAILRTIPPLALGAGLVLLMLGIPRRAPRDGEGRLLDIGAILTLSLLAFPQVHSYQFTVNVVPLLALACAARSRTSPDAWGRACAVAALLLLTWFLWGAGGHTVEAAACLGIAAAVLSRGDGRGNGRAALLAGALTLAWFLAQFQGYGRYEIHFPDTHYLLGEGGTYLRGFFLWIGPFRNALRQNMGILASLLTLALWWILRRRDGPQPEPA